MKYIVCQKLVISFFFTLLLGIAALELIVCFCCLFTYFLLPSFCTKGKGKGKGKGCQFV